MCKCNPNIKTPYCGHIGCEWPSNEKIKANECEYVKTVDGTKVCTKPGKSKLVQGYTCNPHCPNPNGGQCKEEVNKDASNG